MHFFDIPGRVVLHTPGHTPASATQVTSTYLEERKEKHDADEMLIKL